MLFNPPAVDFPRGHLLSPVGNRWVLPGWFCSTGANVVLTAGRQEFIPIFVSQATTYIRIGGRVVVLEAGKAARLGIYAWESGLPGDLVLDAGTVSLAAAAYVEITIAQTLARGFYFLSHVNDTAGVAAMRAVSGTATIWGPVDGYYTLGEPIITYNVLGKTGESAQVAGGLTDPAPTPDTDLAYTQAGIVMLREH